MINPTRWDTKILFTMKEDDLIVAKVKDKNDNYIEEAKKFINTFNYDLAIAGNLLRKAFEGIVNEFEQLLEIGKVERLQKVLEALENDDSYFYDTPHEVLGTLIKDFENMFQNTQQPDDAKIRQIKIRIMFFFIFTKNFIIPCHTSINNFFSFFTFWACIPCPII